MKRKPDLSATALILPVLLIGLLLGAPGREVRGDLTEWIATRETRRAVSRDWERLAAAGMAMPAETAGGRILVFTDYQCDACRRAHQLMKTIEGQERSSVAYFHIPLPYHASADGAARAAICASELGRSREMHERLMTTDEWIYEQNWLTYATAVQITDTAAFNTCLNSSHTAGAIEQHRELARALNIRATPTFVTRSKVLVGVPHLEDLRKMLRSNP